MIQKDYHEKFKLRASTTTGKRKGEDKADCLEERRRVGHGATSCRTLNPKPWLMLCSPAANAKSLFHTRLSASNAAFSTVHRATAKCECLIGSHHEAPNPLLYSHPHSPGWLQWSRRIHPSARPYTPWAPPLNSTKFQMAVACFPTGSKLQST